MSEDRTWLVTVLFLDIVGYSKVPVNQQLATKVHFNATVSKMLDTLDTQECIQLDTGDGCAICYLGDPEIMYPIAIDLCSQFSALGSANEVCYQVRLGLNLGPVKVLDDINGKRNCVGTGINDAQRVMDFAGENQLLVSKSYYDIVSSMSSIYAEQLCAAGSRADKHNKIHEVYELTGAQSDPHQPKVSAGGFDLDETARERLLTEYAKYVGVSAAEASIQKFCTTAASISDLCQLLGDELSEEERYHFSEYTQYYGYS